MFYVSNSHNQYGYIEPLGAWESAYFVFREVYIFLAQPHNNGLVRDSVRWIIVNHVLDISHHRTDSTPSSVPLMVNQTMQIAFSSPNREIVSTTFDVSPST